jgi:PKD repeat protein
MYSDVTGGRGPYNYLWNFGDGSDPSTAADTIHIYEQIGTYTVTLTVTDSLGTTETTTTTVLVSEEASDDVEIVNVKGGLGVSATIRAGDSSVDWSITVNEGYVFLGGHASGTLPAGATETVRLPFTFGIGNVEITVIAGSASVQQQAFMLGPFVFMR